MNKYLDDVGLKHLWGNIKAYIDKKVKSSLSVEGGQEQPSSVKIGTKEIGDIVKLNIIVSEDGTVIGK